MSDSDVDTGLDALAALSRSDLATRWQVVFGCPAPERCRSPLLLAALSWHLQMQGQSASTVPVKRLLRRTRVSVSGPSLAVGTRLVREWQGRTHQVTVLSKGFDYAGRTYPSLSAIVRTITGTPWSGPLFFGLKS